MTKLYVAASESYDRIEQVSSIEEGKKLIEKYEKDDKKEGVYEDNFYTIINELNEAVI